MQFYTVKIKASLQMSDQLWSSSITFHHRPCAESETEAIDRAKQKLDELLDLDMEDSVTILSCSARR